MTRVSLVLYVGLVVGVLSGATGVVLLPFPWDAVLILAVALLVGAMIVAGGLLAARLHIRREEMTCERSSRVPRWP